MTTPYPFVAGQVLTAAQLNDIQNLPISDKVASYVLDVNDAYKRTMMNSASATTITVNNSIFTVGDVIQVANKGAGVCTITAGVGVTINTSGSLALAQYGGGYLLCLSASTFTFFNLGGEPILNLDYLVVGGGGAGGGSIAGEGYGAAGGGGGAVKTGSFKLAKGTYAVLVGAGGAGATIVSGTNGGASGFLATALGGGGGGGVRQSGGGTAGNDGGSGGGGSSGGTGGAGGTGLDGGFNGGAGASGGTEKGGGGGGAGAVGVAGSSTANGGAGVSSSISGSAVGYGGGGGGGDTGVGTDGGGNGGTTSPTAGTTNRGGGGGGAKGAGARAGANGGSGVVIMRYLTATAGGFTFTGGTVTTSGSYTIRTFTASGSLVIA
jgi:hypothetical protein